MSPMLDFGDRIYTAEVLRSRAPDKVIAAIRRLMRGKAQEFEVAEESSAVTGVHGFVASQRAFHRSARLGEGGRVEVPRQESIRGVNHFLYDVVILSRPPFLLVSVPFHGLAETFFVRVDGALAGMRVQYERLNITQIIMQLGAKSDQEDDQEYQLGVTQCQLSYSDQENRSTALQQTRIVGSDLRSTKVYRELIAPVLNPRKFDLTVTPVVLGVSLSEGGIRRATAVTDRHGNFKVWMGSGVVRTRNVFRLLDRIQGMSNCLVETNNVPILQSRTIREAEAE